MENIFNPNKLPKNELVDKIDNMDTARMLVISRMQEHYDNWDEMYIENIETLEQIFYIKKRVKEIMEKRFK